MGKFYFRPPGGESWCDVILRLRSVIDTIAREYRRERVLIIGHQVIVNCLRYLFERLDEQKILEIDRIEDVPNCGVTSYEFDPTAGKNGKLVPGMQNEAAVHALVRVLLPFLSGKKLVLDAYAMGAVSKVAARQSKSARWAAVKEDQRRKTGSEFLITPHAGELAHLTGIDKRVIEAHPRRAARTAARNWNTIVALKGAVAHIANPSARVWRHDGGSVGLGTSGSGDTLAGIIVGLAARGATLEQAAAWGVVLHARAGARLESRFGPLGYMAREIAAEIPSLMHEIGRGR